MARRAVAALVAFLTLMFQKEVAERIVAQPGSDAYGRLSVAAQWRSNPKIAMNVNRSAFVPPPKVTSAVVHIVPTEAPAGVDPKVMERVTEAAFGQRRKMLRSSLKAFPGALGAAQSLGIDVQRRAETLSVDDFVSLARLLVIILFGAVRRFGRRDGRSAADRRRQLGHLRAAFCAANLLQLLQVRLGARRSAHLHHRFSLDRDRVRVVRFDQQGLARHANGLAIEALLLGYPRQVNKSPAVARVDREGRFKHVFRLFQLACANQALASR